MRVFDPVGGRPDLDQFIRDYEEYFRDLERYEYHVQRLIAGYSRGDSQDELRRLFAFALQKVLATDQSIQSKDGPDRHIFSHRGRYTEVFRDALVLLSFGLCLRSSRSDVAALLGCCDRGDPLLETVAGAAVPGLEKPHGAPAFPDTFDGLYAALQASGVEQEQWVKGYLEVWYSVKMNDLSFKDTHKVTDRAIYVGYWCFEAAGIVAALGINDTTFANHPHYPRDLVAFYRGDRS